MNYTIVDLFGRQQSSGTADDFFDKEKHDTIEDAHKADDYIKCDYVEDDEMIKHIQLVHTKHSKDKVYHRLMIQKPLFGLDVFDDKTMVNLAGEMFEKHKKNE